MPPDVELDPAATMYDGLDQVRARGVVVHQEYWKSRGRWRPQSWALSFGVFHGGELIGSQGLEGEDFPMLRTRSRRPGTTTVRRSGFHGLWATWTTA